MRPEEPVVTGEAVALDLRTAGVGSRAVATLIDLVIQYLALLALLLVIGLLAASADDAAVAAVSVVLYVGVLLGYPVVLEWLWRGRTVGKAAMGLRVVRDDGGPIRFRQAFVRGLVGTLVERPGLTFGLAALISMLVTRRSKRLGDLLAGTVVLLDRVPTGSEAMVTMPPQLAGWAATLDLSALDDSFALRLRQFLARAGQLAPASRARLEADYAEQVAARVGHPPPGTPGWSLLAAVVAERRNRQLLTLAKPPGSPPTSARPDPPAPPTRNGFAPPA